MAATSEARALPFFTDLYGLPLESGSIYIGQPGLDPVASPQNVYSDATRQTLIQQPVRTTHGRAVSGGAQVHLFCQVPYSIVILDTAGRTVYAALNETDPIFVALATSIVQSASSLSDLRARSGLSTNLVWVAGFGTYRFDPTDTTSPENSPFVIVGNDGSRYQLDQFDGNMGFARLSAPSSNPNSAGLWLSYNDQGDGAGRITNNQGVGAGGLVIRNIDQSNTTETGRVTIGANGSILTTGQIATAGANDIVSNRDLVASSGMASLTADKSRYLRWDGTVYLLVGAELTLNGGRAYHTNWFNPLVLNGIGNTRIFTVTSVPVGTTFSPGGAPGTWLSTGVFNDHDNNGTTIAVRIV